MDANVRNACGERSRGLCECGCGRAAAELDHQEGRARSESIETCWFLAVECHRLKTNNDPDRIHWLLLFALHCLRHGYAVAAAKAIREALWSGSKRAAAQGVGL